MRYRDDGMAKRNCRNCIAVSPILACGIGGNESQNHNKCYEVIGVLFFILTFALITMNDSLFDFYRSKADGLSETIVRLKRLNRAFVAAELATFLLAIASVVAFTAVDGVGEWPLYLAAALLLLYVAVRRLDVKNGERIEAMENRRSVYEKELKYLSGDFAPFDDGGRYVDAKHEYAFDMDIFGPQSLYHRICRAVTTGGADRLAATLNACALSANGTSGDINRLNEAIKELAEQEEWRANFLSFGQKERIDTAAVTSALDGMKAVRMSSVMASRAALCVAWAAVAGFWVSVALSLFSSVSANLPLWWGVWQFSVIYIMCSNQLRSISKTVGRLHKQLKSYVGLMRLMLNLNPKTEGNKALVQALSDNGGDALTSFAEMERIIDGLDRRGNALGMILFDALFLSDFFLVRRFLRWQRLYMGSIQSWIDAVSDIDARVSMATFRYNEPTATDAEIVDAEKVVFEAEGMWHPFLGGKAVRNDFTITDGNYYIVTGANMAGKSTFLRSIGVNYILARAGMPVFAAHLRVSLFSLFSSMRTSDDLAHGISYFNAELLRLRQLIDSCKRSLRTLIILDEILKGTNSLDKLNGSRMFLNAISSLPVSGVIATHDLELSKMAAEKPDRFHNYCFEIRLSDEITYTYKIAAGVARNQNATYLLRNIIKDI